MWGAADTHTDDSGRARKSWLRRPRTGLDKRRIEWELRTADTDSMRLAYTLLLATAA
ncbi:MAG: hypothetical protein QOK49_1174, partial [Baekduia sp.]|nr:hypothetical protein [Baekduia sp.]